MPSYPLLLGLGDVGEPVPLNGHNRPDISLVRCYLIKLFIKVELEVDRPELDQPVEQGGGSADIPLLGLLVISNLGEKNIQSLYIGTHGENI